MRDAHNANQCFGPDLANLRGKTTRTKPEHIRVDYVKIPQDFVKIHKYVTLVADIIFVNGMLFLATSLRGIRLVKIECLASQTAKCLAITLEKVKRVYGTAGFIVQLL